MKRNIKCILEKEISFYKSKLQFFNIVKYDKQRINYNCDLESFLFIIKIEDNILIIENLYLTLTPIRL